MNAKKRDYYHEPYTRRFLSLNSDETTMLSKTRILISIKFTDYKIMRIITSGDMVKYFSVEMTKVEIG